jgi:hypothetical protein
MATTMEQLPVRTSSALRGLIDQAGPVNAATRALIILGAAAAGLELRMVEREVFALLGCEGLAPEVRAALVQVAVGRGASGSAIASALTSDSTSDSTAAITPLSPSITEDDLFGEVGIDV